eukprot:gene11538-4791_t
MVMEENEVSSFKKWLCDNLKDVADAEPEILSNYIYALIKDEPSKEECISKLEDFLYENTVPFVNKIYTALKTKEYLSRGGDIQREKKNRYEEDERRRRYEEEERRRRYEEEEERRARYERQQQRDIERRRHHSPQRRESPERNYRRNSPDRYHKRDHSPDRNYQRSEKPKYKSKKFAEEEKKRETGNSMGNKNTSDTLTVSNIPPELNNIETLNGHFKKFGSILNINIKKDAKKADIQFGSNREAYLAWKSPDAVLDNRFIKVFWFKEEKEETKPEKKIYQKKPLQPVAPPVFVPKPGFAKQGTDAEKEKKIKTLLTSTQQNLDIQLKTYKELVAKLEKMEDSTEKIEMTKKLSVLFNNLQSSMLAQQKAMEEAKQKREEEKRKREQDETETTIEESEEPQPKKVKVDDEKTETETTEGTIEKQDSTTSFRGGFRGRGARGRGSWTRGTTGRPSFNLDNRTTTFHVKNIPNELQNEDSIRQHFQVFGQINNLVLDSDGSSTIEFEKRKSAEMAIIKGKMMGETKLEFAWKNKTSEPKVEVEQYVTEERQNFEDEDNDRSWKK